jgi:hypothetical protein
VTVYARRRPQRRRRRTALWLVALGIAFVLGIGLGEALHEGPPRGSQTLVRTLKPAALVPVARATTVTVTTSTP